VFSLRNDQKETKMAFSKRCILAAWLALVLASGAGAQTKLPPETRNAALRYWMAFAELQDTDADKATADLLQKTMNGDAAWDEAKLGRIVDDNIESIRIMQRATKLPECDWGLEYSLGPSTPIPFVKNSARALARLNTLYGLRSAAKGETQKAVDAWLAGIRFSQDLAHGESLFATLTASNALSSNLRALTKAAQANTLSAEQRKQVLAAVRALPESGFDWGQVMWYEGLAADVMTKDLIHGADPTAYYRQWFGTPAPPGFAPPSATDFAAFHKWMTFVEAALRLPPDQARGKLEVLQDSIGNLHPLFQAAIPNVQRINEARRQVQSTRDTLLQVLTTP
jgi:hypothetical protein